jgi:flagellar protein FlaJ
MRVEKVYRRVRWMYPKPYIRWLEKSLVYADVGIGLEKFVSLTFLYAMSFGLFAYVLLLLFNQPLIALVALVVTFLIVHVVIDLLVVLIGDKRGRFVEEMLPDALQLMAANIRSGLTPDRALLFTARPEFGILEKEIKVAAGKAVAGEPLEETLLSIGNRIKSRIIERTFALIVEGMRKGGEMASLLEQTAEDIRNLKLLKKEIAAQVGMYSIFVFVSIGMAAPLLFGLSTYLVETMSNIGSAMRIEQAGQYAGMVGGLRISFVAYPPEFLQYYSLAFLFMNSFFGSLLIGLLQEGTEKAGLKYVPMLLVMNLVIFMATKTVTTQFIGVMTPAVRLT